MLPFHGRETGVIQHLSMCPTPSLSLSPCLATLVHVGFHFLQQATLLPALVKPLVSSIAWDVSTLILAVVPAHASEVSPDKLI